MYRLITVALAIVAVTVAEPAAEPEADPQFLYYGAPTVPYVHSSYAAPKVYYEQPTVEYTPSVEYAPTTYAANPLIWDSLNHQSKGSYLPGIFGWERGHNHFKHFLKKKHFEPNYMAHRYNGFRGLRGGADSNKYTDGKYTTKREAGAEPEADPQYYVSSPYYQPMVSYYGYDAPQATVQYAPSAVTPTVHYPATTYAANPLIWDSLTQVSKGSYLPGIFGWKRGDDNFKHFLKKKHFEPCYHCHRYNGFRGLRGGADSNKYTDGKYTTKREAGPEPEADPQYYISSPSYYQPMVYNYAAPQAYYVPTSVTPSVEYTPTPYAANPLMWDNWTQVSKGSYLPGLFGWERGNNHFKHFLKKKHFEPNYHALRANGFRGLRGGADSNKYTDGKYTT